jgi:hypothetical protein
MRFLLLCALALSFTPATAADFRLVREQVEQIADVESHTVMRLVISGTIEQGDSARLLALARSSPVSLYLATGSVLLDSNGGDVREAMRLADTLKSLYPVIGVRPNGKCVSSCLLLWLSGAMRVAEPGSIGIHRPYFAPAYFRGLTMTDAESQYEAMSDSFRSFVLRQGLPQSLYEKLLATPSEGVYWLTSQDIRLIGPGPPYFQERLLASCGELITAQPPRPQESLICMQDMLTPDRERAMDQLFGAELNEDWEAYMDREKLQSAQSN